MIILRKLLCILGWHDWFYFMPGDKVRRCLLCSRVEYLHDGGMYFKHWCDKP